MTDKAVGGASAAYLPERKDGAVMAGRKDNKGRVLREGESRRKDGTYDFRYTEHGKRKSFYAKTLQELREKETQLSKNNLLGISAAGGKMTLNEMFEIYMQSKQVRDSTIVTQRGLWKHNVADAIGYIRICDLKKVTLQMFYKKLSESGKKSSSIKIIHNLIHGALELACDNDYVSKNVSRNAMKTIVKDDKQEKEALSEQQIMDLLAFCEESIYNIYTPMLTILFLTGMRVGEWTGLCWNNVDFKNRVIHIDHQLIYKNIDGTGWRLHIHKPKTKSGVRDIPMSETVYKAFLKQKEIYRILDRRNTTIIDGVGNFIFATSNGTPYSTAGANGFLRHLEGAYNRKHPKKKIPHLTTHILRHTAASLMVSKEMNIASVSKILGHSDIATTLNTYTHSTEGQEKAEVEKLDNAIDF